jgi:hypothetical protein
MPPAEQLYAENLALQAEVSSVREENAQLRVQIAWLNLSSATGIEKWLFSGVAAMQVVELQ